MAKTAVSSDILFDQFMTVPTSQQQILTNIHIKSQFITMLRENFTTAHISVKQSDNDADVHITETAINQFITLHVTVVGEDVDLLVYLPLELELKKSFTF